MPRPSFLLALFFLMGFVAPAQAYIDPNAGGLLFQLLAPVFAAVVGAWLVARRWLAAHCQRLWQRLWRRKTGRPDA